MSMYSVLQVQVCSRQGVKVTLRSAHNSLQCCISVLHIHPSVHLVALLDRIG